MSVSQQDIDKSNSTNSFVTALATNAALLVVQVGAFTYLKGRLQRVYTPRSFLPPPEKRAEELPRGPWKWFMALLTSPSKDLIRKNGLDAYLFIRFLRLLMMIFGVFTLLTWPVLLVVDTAGIPDNQGRDGLSRLSWGNIPTNMQSRYAAHITVVYILTFFVIWLIRREFGIFVKLRHQFLISHSHSKLAQAKTVLITNLPESVQTDQDLRKLLTFVPGGISKVWIYRKLGDLTKWYEDRLKVCEKLEKAECELLRDALKAKRAEEKAKSDAEKQAKKAAKKASKVSSPDQQIPLTLIQHDTEEKGTATAFSKVVRPTHRLGKMPFVGPKVDTITWCKDEIARLNTLINEGRKSLKHGESYAAFVECNLQIGAHVLSQVVVSDEPMHMADKWTDVDSNDIVWRNIDDSGYEMRFRYVMSWIAMAILIVLWSFPVAFVGMLSNISALCIKVPWLAWICRLNNIPQGIISGLLPPVFLAILLLILPVILRALAWYENITRYSLISISLYKRYFIFLIIHGFLVVTLSSGLTAAIPQILEQPGTIVESLARRLPDAATFFLTYTVTTGFAGAASALLQLVPLLLYFVNRWLFGDTPRQAYKKTFLMPNADFGEILPRVSLVAAIAMAYSVVAPIINGLALLTFFLLWVAWKFLFTWVFDQPEAAETGGLYYPLALGNLFIGLYIEQICLCGLFFLATDADGNRSAIPQGALVFALLIVTFSAQMFFRSTYSPLIAHLPTALSTKKIQDRFERKSKGQHDILPDLFSRERVTKLVRRKLKIESKPVDAHAVLAEEKRKEDVKIEEKEQKAKENVHDLEMLSSLINSSLVFGKSTSADPTGEASRPALQDPAPSGQVGPSSSPAASAPEGGKALSREDTVDSKRSNGSKAKKSKRPQIAEAASAIHAEFAADTRDDSDSSDDDNEDNAFNHPAMYRQAPVIWIPKDDLGLSTLLVAELNNGNVFSSDMGAFIDAKGNVDVTRNPPDEEWSGGHDV